MGILKSRLKWKVSLEEVPAEAVRMKKKRVLRFILICLLSGIVLIGITMPVSLVCMVLFGKKEKNSSGQ